MRLHFVWIGKTKERHSAALVDDYLKRVTRFCPVETSELKEPSTARDEKHLVQLEGEKILASIERDDFVVLLDERGRPFSSPVLAEWMGARQQASVKRLAFIIGGYAGVSQAVRERVQLTWSLSSLTLPHELARVVLAEQIYRAFTLLAGLPYHKP